MNYTKGEWTADNGESELWGIFQKEDCKGIAYLCEPDGTLLCPEQAEANARLIVAAVNGCISVNPDNPLAVAEDIKDMYESLRLTTKASDEEIIEENIQNWHNRIFGEEK